MEKCPVCRSTRIKRIEGTNNFRCDKCGYEHQEGDRPPRGKVLRSDGNIQENWWMR